MVKRISCKVINSVPLRKTGVALECASPFINQLHENTHIRASNTILEQIVNPDKTYKIPGAALEISDYPAGLILDCQV